MRTRVRIGLAVFATLIALASCEAIARVLFPAPPDPTRQPQIVYRFDPDIRYVMMPNQRGWIEDGFVTTNSLGFRGGEVAIPKPRVRFRVVAIGDSVTFGFGVNDADTFCSQLERLLQARSPDRDIDVVNLAVGGYDTRQEVGLLKRNASRLEPDLVLVGFYSNDVPDSLEEKDSIAGGGGTTIATHAEIGQVLHMNPVPSSWLDIQMRRSRAIYTAGRAFKRLTHRGEWGMSRYSMELDLLEGRDSPELNTAWGRVAKQLSDLHATATAEHFSVGIVVLPPREQVMGVYSNAHYQNKLRAIAEQLGFFVIDPLPALAKSKTKTDALFIPYDRNHPSAAGHRVIAQTIAEYFDQHEQFGLMSRRVAGSGSARLR